MMSSTRSRVGSTSSSTIAAVDQEDHPVGVRRGARVVGDHHDRLAQVVDDRPQEAAAAPVPALRVQRAGRLVGEDHLGSGDQRPTDGDALLLPPESSEGRWVSRSPQVQLVHHGLEPPAIRRAAGEIDRAG